MTFKIPRKYGMVSLLETPPTHKVLGQGKSEAKATVATANYIKM